VTAGNRALVAAEARDLSYFHCGLTGSGAHPASYLTGTSALSPGIKWLRTEAQPSFSSSFVFKNAWSYNCVNLHVAVLINTWVNFNFT
jgi:hypothetical protein